LEINLFFSVVKTSFFVTIASVLGTGILGLPVKTANSGFFPFLVIFAVVLVFEVTPSPFPIYHFILTSANAVASRVLTSAR
jgi:amino acid permease